MLNLAVVGKDVSKSLSPKMHDFILKRMGECCRYAAVSVPEEAFPLRAEEFFRAYDGFNVTIPYKTAILPYLRERGGDAAASGAVNTVLSRERKGYNTDGEGFLLMLENAGVAVRGKRVLLLGAGGAGRSCIHKLCRAGADVFVYERNRGRLLTVFRELGAFTPLEKVPDEAFDVAVNCTGVGMYPGAGQTPDVVFTDGVYPVGEKFLSRCGVAVDLIYEPPQSEFLRIAASCGKRTINGEAMLFYQAYLADCIYLNRESSPSEAKEFYGEYLAVGGSL